MRVYLPRILPLALLLFILLFPTILDAQKWTSKTRDTFREGVNSITVWTYISNDPGFRYYSEVKDEVTLFLNRKGYKVNFIHYDSTKTISPSEWKQQQIASLKKNDALLEISTLILLDSIEMAQRENSRKDQVIMDERGRAISTTQIHDPTLTVDTSYQFIGNASLYVSEVLAGLDSLLVFSRNFSTQRMDPITIIHRLLANIPSCKHSILSESYSRPLFQGNVVVEFYGVGGYLFPSSMELQRTSVVNVVDGSADFDGNASYGFGVSFGFTKSLDLKLVYRHEGTKVKINMPSYADSSQMKFQLNYILFGADYNFRVTPWFSPFVGAAIGPVQMSPLNDYYREVWYFALNAEVGTKFYVNRWLGFRVQGELFWQFHSKHSPFLYSMYDVSISEDAMTNLLQLGISAGVIFRIK